MDFVRRWIVSRDLKRAKALEGEGYLEQALSAYEAALEFAVEKDRALALRQFASCALRLGKLAAAREALSESVKIAPTDADAWLLLGNACLELRDTYGADEALNEALKHAPDRVDILQVQAEYYAIKLPRAAFEAGKRVLERVLEFPGEADRLGFPRELPVVFLRNLAAEQRFVDETVAYFDELAARASAGSLPGLRWIRPIVLNHKGVLLANVGRYDEAIQAYLGALTADPEFEAPYFNLGMVHTRKRDFESARASFSVWAKRHPSDAVTTFGFGFMAESKPDVPEMIRLYTFFLDRMKVNPPDPPSLGRLDVARGWAKHAQTVVEQARKHQLEDHEKIGPREVTDEGDPVGPSL